MSEDRLDKALEAMKNENINAEELAGAHNRVLEKLKVPSEALCTEFQLQFRDYAEGRLDGNHRLLMEDHLSRCPKCRTKFAEQKDAHPGTVVPMPRVSRWPRWGTWAAAAALMISLLYFGRTYIDAMLALGGPRATVASVSGKLYRLPQGILESGSKISEGEVIRTGPGTRAVLKLADGSLVDVNERTELSLHAAWSGKTVQLQRGDIIVQAAKQRHGYLRVQTRDSLASVKGTIFAVSAGLSGSLVSVVEGSVAVAQLGTEILLSSGEQAASNQALLSSTEEAIAWSPDAETYIAMLASLATIQKQIAALPSQPMRTQSLLLQQLPPNTVVYGSIPNLGGTIGQAMTFADQQSAENPAFGQWWNSIYGQSLKKLLGHAETVTHLLGNEIAFGYSLGVPGSSEKFPMILAQVLSSKEEALAAELSTLAGQTDSTGLPYRITNSLMVLSDSPQHLQLLLSSLGQGGSTPFAQEIAARYQKGVGSLLCMDIDSMASVSGIAERDFLNSGQIKHLILERRDTQGAEENSIAVTFKGPRMGLASFLANSGSGGAADFIPSDVIAAGYVATREPRQMFDEIMALINRSDPSAQERLSQVEAALGMSFSNDFAASMGTESAFALESLSIKGPVVIMAAMVNDPVTLEASLRKLVDIWNAENERAGRTERVVMGQETIDGRTWTTLKPSSALLSLTWTYDHGYMVAASDRAAALRALATRNSGSPLVWSQAFQQQLSGASGLHPSGFAWLNTGGAFQNFAALVPNPTIQNLINGHDPILVVFSAGTEQIRAVSRTRLSGMILDMLLMEGLSQFKLGS